MKDFTKGDDNMRKNTVLQCNDCKFGKWNEFRRINLCTKSSVFVLRIFDKDGNCTMKVPREEK